MRLPMGCNSSPLAVGKPSICDGLEYGAGFEQGFYPRERRLFG